MSNKKGLFAMTRHERAGAVAVLVLLVVAICAHVWVSHKGVSAEDVDVAAIQVFEHRCDSLEAVKASKPKKQPKQGGNKKTAAKNKPDKARKSPPQGHKMDPVPGF